MKTKIPFYLLIVIIGAFILSFEVSEQHFLPTVIHINHPGKFDKELLLNLRASMANRKIKTISKDEAMELQRVEHDRVMVPYYENLKRTGGSLNFDEVKTYMSLNSRKVCNSLSIEIKVTDEGIIQDTIRWVSNTLPFDFLNIKKGWDGMMVLSAEQKTSIIHITQAITDSIIASNALVKE
jgi:hypothetical protein